MNGDRVVQLLEEIRDFQRQLVDSYQQVLQNQREIIQEQRQAMARWTRVQWALGSVVAILLVIVLALLRYMLQRF